MVICSSICCDDYLLFVSVCFKSKIDVNGSKWRSKLHRSQVASLSYHNSFPPSVNELLPSAARPYTLQILLSHIELYLSFITSAHELGASIQCGSAKHSR